ncbi:MAG: hypothetical protein MUF73_19125 [Rhodobacteraceae bacterium]|jgi:general secretion pathway protein C|nr:hypothetical protein [Paracoccaceae bacterium]
MTLAARLVEWSLAAAATAWVGGSAGPLVWQALAGPTLPVPDVAPTAVSAGTPSVEPDAVDRLLAAAPFGRAPVADAPVAAADIPATALQVTLLGVTLADDPRLSRAIIAAEGQGPESYAVGAAVTATVRLAAVEANRVLLAVGDRTEALGFPERPSGDPASLAPVGLPFGFAPGLVPAVAEGPPSRDPDTVIAWYRAEIDRSPDAVMDRLGIAATPEGYRILDTAPPDVRQAGFLPGDVVAEVNGVAVGDVEGDRLRLDEIIAAGRASVAVRRGGETIRLSFPLR